MNAEDSRRCDTCHHWTGPNDVMGGKGACMAKVPEWAAQVISFYAKWHRMYQPCDGPEILYGVEQCEAYRKRGTAENAVVAAPVERSPEDDGKFWEDLKW